MPGRACTTRAPGRSCARWRSWLGAPVATSLGGKSAFPENHPLALGSGGVAIPKTVHHFLTADVIFGIGCSFTETAFGDRDAEGQAVHPRHARSRPSEQGRARRDRPRRRCRADAGGAARRTRRSLLPAPRDRPRRRGRSRRSAKAGSPSGCRSSRRTRRRCRPIACSGICGTRSIVANTIITHDAGSPRDQLSPFWVSTDAAPLYRLGQDDAARLRPRPGHGREAGQNPTSSASMSGATRRSASPAWISRPRCASGFRSCRSCSTTSRWRSS